MNAMAPDVFTDGPGKVAQIVMWRNGGAQQFESRWGLRPVDESGKSVALLRSENWPITNPCLIVANEFFVKPDGSKRNHRVTFITDEPFFCFAGMWRPASRDWPASFAALTVPAYPDISPLKDRNMAVVRPEDWQDWLCQTRIKEEILRPFPKGSFLVVPPAKAVTRDLFDI
jgi:putative SOS response-associated peptidase YedK